MRRFGLLTLIVLGGFAVGGIVSPNSPVPAVGEAGAPHRTLTPAEETRFLRGRLLFDKDFPSGEGVGPVFNGDSCRALTGQPA